MAPRERELVKATRALFDERGMQDAPIAEIAAAVGIPRGLVYRSFSSKEELFVMTVTDYLAELDGLLGAASDDGSAEEHLHAIACAFAGFCERYPAFLDCSLSLMRRPAAELRHAIGDAVWLRLGQGMAACIEHVAAALRALGLEDADFTANVLWTQMLGAMHLARIRVGLRAAAPGVPEVFKVSSQQVVDTCVAHALAAVGVESPA